MPIDFDEKYCQSNTAAEKFGLIDNEDSTPARICFDDNEKWNATVVNKNAIPLIFTAIDHCIEIFRDDGNMESRCDGMLNYKDNIIFVELKNVGGGWITEGIEQLEKTIEIYKENHDLAVLRKRRAVVANRRHPNFHTISNEIMQRFYSKHKVRLHIGGTIEV